jgi:hypothetical protein
MLDSAFDFHSLARLNESIPFNAAINLNSAINDGTINSWFYEAFSFNSTIDFDALSLR